MIYLIVQFRALDCMLHSSEEIYMCTHHLCCPSPAPLINASAHAHESPLRTSWCPPCPSFLCTVPATGAHTTTAMQQAEVMSTSLIVLEPDDEMHRHMSQTVGKIYRWEHGITIVVSCGFTFRVPHLFNLWYYLLFSSDYDHLLFSFFCLLSSVMVCFSCWCCCLFRWFTLTHVLVIMF